MVRIHVRNLTCLICVFIVVSCYTQVCKAAEDGSFTGHWTANGTQESLSFGELGATSLVKLSGHVQLNDTLGNEKDYWSTCIGLTDNSKGGDFRCVWRSLGGQEIYIVLKSERMEQQSRATGEIVGGTGAAKNMKGSLRLHWSTLSFQTNKGTTEIGGYAKDLQGTFQLP